MLSLDNGESPVTTLHVDTRDVQEKGNDKYALCIPESWKLDTLATVRDRHEDLI